MTIFGTMILIATLLLVGLVVYVTKWLDGECPSCRRWQDVTDAKTPEELFQQQVEVQTRRHQTLKECSILLTNAEPFVKTAADYNLDARKWLAEAAAIMRAH